MNRRDVSLALGLNIALGVLVVLSFGTGWIALYLGLSEFGIHKWASIALVIGIVIHVALHHRMLTRHRPHKRPPHKPR